MPKQRLTDRQLISGVTLTDLLHFVVTGDTSQSPAGSSYKGSVEQLFNGFSSYTCSTPLLLDTVNACTSAITINGNVIINGSATTINTEVIQSKDNNIVLNYSGTHLTAIGGGITLEDGVSDGVDSKIFTNSDGVWLFDPGLSASTGTIDDFTANTISVTTIGNSGDCVNDLYVSNIHSCSPLNINPLDEGNIYFGSTSGVTIDLTNNRVGIGTSTPSEKLEVVGTNGIFYSKLDDTEVQIQLSAQTTSGVTNISTSSPNAGSLLFGIRGIDNTSNPGFGKSKDSFIYSSIVNNGLNIISQKGFPQTTDDYIRFYAGQLATTGNTPDLYIQGSGSTRGYIGINNDSPTEQLDVVGNTKISEDLFVGDTVYVGNVTGTPTTNASLYITQPSITGSTESPIIDIQVDDANSYFRINNATATDGFFTPSITTRQSDSPDRLSLFFDALVEDAQDTPGAADVMRFRARRDTPDFIQNRDLYAWYNYTTRLMDLDKDGNLDIIQGGLRINTLGTGTSVNNLGIDSSGNVVTGTTGGGTFTGNTSGDCITDLYVTNLYGCSPLHIEPSGLNDVYLVENGGNVGISNDNPQYTLDVTGEARISGSGQNILTIIGSGDTNPLFTIQGSSGELFSITDSLVGSLFSVNDISGLPILEVFDDDTVHMGSYQAPSLNTTVRLTPSTGLSTVYSIPMSAYTGAWFEYTVSHPDGARAGQIMSIFSGNIVNFTETTTTDIGSTSDITFSMSADSTNTLLQVSATTTGWEVKTIVRSI